MIHIGFLYPVIVPGIRDLSPTAHHNESRPVNDPEGLRSLAHKLPLEIDLSSSDFSACASGISPSDVEIYKVLTSDRRDKKNFNEAQMQ